jgi:hypothetical protein
MFRTQPSVTSTATPEAVYDVIADLRNHLVWSGERAEDDGFKMLTLEAPDGTATVGTTGSARRGALDRWVGRTARRLASLAVPMRVRDEGRAKARLGRGGHRR